MRLTAAYDNLQVCTVSRFCDTVLSVNEDIPEVAKSSPKEFGRNAIILTNNLILYPKTSKTIIVLIILVYIVDSKKFLILSQWNIDVS